MRSRFARARSFSRAAESFLSITLSHSGPLNRSRAEASSRKPRSSAREAAENLGPDVVADELIGQRARADRRRSVLRFRADRERRQIQAGGPALRAPVDRRDLLGGQVDAGRSEDGARIVIAELEIARIDQGPAPAGEDPGDRQATRRPAGEHELRPAVKVARERNEHVGRIRLGEPIDVVQDQDERRRLCRESGAEARHGHRPDRRARRGQGFVHLRRRGRRPRRARMQCRQSRTDGSLSRSSIDSQAKCLGSLSDHCARRVDFPYPAGATTATTGTSLLATSRSMRASRRSRPVRGGGGTSFVSRTGKPLASRRTSARDARARCARAVVIGASERSADTRPERPTAQARTVRTWVARSAMRPPERIPHGSRSTTPPLRRGHGARGTGGTDALRILLHEPGEATPEAFPSSGRCAWTTYADG